MRVTRLINANGIRYAAGELLLIVAGIVIALAISDWHAKRLERQQELAMLAEISAALVTDAATIESRLGTWREVAARIEALIVVLDSQSSFDPRYQALFGAPYGIRPVKLNTAAYESLKSMGLQSISNADLRQRIATVFDEHYESVTIINGVENSVVGILRDYYLTNFTELRFLTSAMPLDYAATISDPYYRNLVDYRLKVIVNNQLVTYPQVLADMYETLKLLELELAGSGDIANGVGA